MILFNKPYRVLSQFSDAESRETLATYIDQSKVYPAGRLDYDSEGVLLLTDDGRLQEHISQPRSKLPKHYWVQVDGEAADSQLEQLLSGVTLKDGLAVAIAATQIAEPQGLWPREPPIRVRKKIPTSWLDVVIDEGRNRQVRRMTAAVRLPALRLIRHRVGPWSLGDLAPGASTSIDNDAAWKTLRD